MSTGADMDCIADCLNRWLLAARRHTLAAGIAPVLVESALAIHDGAFRSDVLVVTMLAAIAIQIGVNFANDVADAARGADTDERIGPTRAVAAGLITPTRWAAIALGVRLPAVCGLYLTRVAGWVVIVIGVASIVAALGYTNGPIPYGYYGLGEVFVFVFFGLVATVGSRYVYDGSIDAGAWNGGVVMGLFASAILVANNLRDIDTDRAAGKRTLAVILGRRTTRILYGLAMVAPLGIVVVAVIADTRSLILARAGHVALAYPPVLAVTKHEDGPTLIQALKGTGRYQLAFAVVLAVTIAV